MVCFREGARQVSRVTHQFPGLLTELPDSVIDSVQWLPGGEVQEVEGVVKVGKCLGEVEEAVKPCGRLGCFRQVFTQVVESLRAVRAPPVQPEAPERSLSLGNGAYIEVAMHRRLVDSIESTIFLTLTAGEVEETLEGCHTFPRVAYPFNREVLGEVQGACSLDTGRLIQWSEWQCGLEAAVVAWMSDPGHGAVLQRGRGINSHL